MNFQDGQIRVGIFTDHLRNQLRFVGEAHSTSVASPLTWLLVIDVPFGIDDKAGTGAGRRRNPLLQWLASLRSW